MTPAKFSGNVDGFMDVIQWEADELASARGAVLCRVILYSRRLPYPSWEYEDVPFYTLRHYFNEDGIEVAMWSACGGAWQPMRRTWADSILARTQIVKRFNNTESYT